MNRVILGILCGIVFGLLDAAMVVLRQAPRQIAGNALASIFQSLVELQRAAG